MQFLAYNSLCLLFKHIHHVHYAKTAVCNIVNNIYQINLHIFN